jgi:Tfp pilus assembly protein PilN
MSTAVKEKKPFLPQRKTTVPAGTTGNAVVASNSRANSANNLAIGGEPRVHLLPLDVSERKQMRQLKRRLGIGVVAAVVVVAAAYGAVTVSLATAQSQLANEQARTTQLAAQQAKFSAVTKVKADSAAIQAAQKTASSAEVVWKPYVQDIEASLPAGSAIVDFNGTVDAPLGGTATTVTPLGAPHVATIQLTVTMTQNPIGGWLTTLPSLKGFVDATPDSIAKKSDGIYTVVVTIHLDKSALSTRYTKADGETK